MCREVTRKCQKVKFWSLTTYVCGLVKQKHQSIYYCSKAQLVRILVYQYVERLCLVYGDFYWIVDVVYCHILNNNNNLYSFIAGCELYNRCLLVGFFFKLMLITFFYWYLAMHIPKQPQFSVSYILVFSKEL